MTYYTEIRKVNLYLDSFFKKRVNFSIKKLVYDISLKFEVSEKHIIKKINIAKEIYNFEIYGDEVEFQ